MSKFRKTKNGIPICPYFIWTSENIERLGQQENDVNLTFCSHFDNKNNCEGNCQEELCPLIKNISNTQEER